MPIKDSHPKPVYIHMIMICVVVSKKESRTARNIFIFNLAISDIMIALSIPLTLVDGFNMSWTLPPLLPLCQLVKTFPCVAVFMSSLSLMAIAGDRYRVILCPHSLQVGPRQAWAALPAIFILSCLLSSFVFFRTNLYTMAELLVRPSTLSAPLMI